MSDGGQVALEFGLRHPGRSRGLLVGAAYPDFQTDFAREMVRGVFHGDTDGVIDFEAVERESPLLVEFWRTNHNQDDDQWLRVAQQTLTMCLEYPGLTQRQVESISDPALVIQGDTDELVPLAAAMDLFSWLPNAEFAVLPGTDHFRPVVDPTLMVAVMRDYMRRHQ